jgi:hypothetical protein
MNWASLLTVAVNVVDKNPELAENLLTSLFTLLASNQTMLAKVVSVGLSHAEAALPVATAAAPAEQA